MAKYMVLCVAGQSNAVGFDESPVQADYLNNFHTDRLWQLGFLPEHNLKIVPLGACAENYQDMRPFGNPATPGIGTKGMQLPLADLLLADIPADYDILVIPCAYGGCGFTVGAEGSYDPIRLRPSEGQLHWGVHSPFYLAMKDRITYALQLDPANRFLGVVWVQGEHDHDSPRQQMAAFDEMTQDFFTEMQRRNPGRVYRINAEREGRKLSENVRKQQASLRVDGHSERTEADVPAGAKAQPEWSRDLWYNVETVAYWYENFEGCRQIWAHYRAWNPATYVPIPRDTDSNEVNGTGITASIRAAHFGNDAFWKVVAPRVAAAMKSSGK